MVILYYQVDPWDYAEHLAEAMQLYEPVDYLRGSTVLYDWTDEVCNVI